MKVMIAAGGTGGHIYPALALADTLKKQKPDSEIVFFGSDNRMEAQVIPAKGYRFYGISMTGTNGGILAKVKSVAGMLKAQRYAKKILETEKPDICVGFGNYISVPLIMAAHKMHIPTMIHEQNSFAGKANKFLAKYVDAIASCYDENLKQMPAEKQRILGNPEASVAVNTVYDPGTLKQYGLDPEKPFAVFMMGSLGSSSVSKVIDEACPLFDDSYQILIAKGNSNDYTFRYESNERIQIVPYIDGKQMLKGCEVAVVRAGATTMAELGAIGCASVLIPSPFVPNNHQYFNAKDFADKHAAILLEEKNLNAHSLSSTLNDLMKNPNEVQSLKKNAYALGKRDAAEEMIAWMEEIVNESSVR